MRTTNLTLTDMLLEMAEKLTDNKITGKALDEQIKRAQSLTSVASQVVNLKDCAVRELDTNIKAVKIAASVGMNYKPEGLALEPMKNVNALPDGYKGTDKKGITPEGLEYEW